MILFSLLFLVGVLALQFFSYLPDWKGVFFLSSFFLILLILLKRKFSQSFLQKMIFISLLGFILGFSWCLGFVAHRLQWTLPADMEGQTVTAWGTVASIPDYSNHLTSFEFKLHKLKLKNLTHHGVTKVRLTWRSHIEPNIHVGEEWRLKIRLKKVHGLANPGGFDFEAYALQEGIRATGYVVDKEQQFRLHSPGPSWWIGALREHLKNQIQRVLLDSPTAPWIVALVVGERHHIDSSQWDVLRNTGTNHLMAIAGLHIGFMSGFMYFFMNRLCRLYSPVLLIYPAQQIASIAALLMAFFYSALAGFSLPTQRACIMLSVFLATRVLHLKTFSWQALSLALIFVLFLNPLSVLTESFWLSFGAVALIIYGTSSRLAAHSLWWKWGRLQWVTALGLIPICLWLFQQCSLVSFAANAIAIPWVGLMIVPCSLLGSLLLLFSPQLGGWILIIADKSLSLLWMILTGFSHLSWSSWFHPVSSYWILCSSLFAVILLLLPIGFPGRWFSLVWLIPLLITPAARPAYGELKLTLLDVGQGLSTIVQTARHVLVFDAGAKLGSNYDMGESVVTPFLHHQFISRIHMLVVSHGDNDHRGGVESVLKHFVVDELRTSVPDQIPLPISHYCLRGQSWEWDGIQFKFLYPTVENLGKGNNSSCVLSISNGYHRILLTGDIENFAEKYLVENEIESLSSSILVAPHHGSKTSALNSFLNQVHPNFVLFPIGYRNRYHFPHGIVLQKYEELGSLKLDTAKEGALLFNVNSKTSYISFRNLHHHYWNN